MGFYIRKSISAGPFRFNLSGSGVGMSVGVKGFRVGTSPRGNYIHMGRGGLYYRASLGGNRRKAANYNRIVNSPPTKLPFGYGEKMSPIETGDVVEMTPSNGSDVLQQINEKLSLHRLWPWTLAISVAFSVFVPAVAPLLLILTAVLTGIAAWWDQSRKVVVIMYDLADDVTAKFKNFSDELEKVGLSNRIWNVDTAGRTDDWKRNAGAGRILTRKQAYVTQGVPSVIKMNVSVPSIIGGKQNIYFLPDIILIVEGKRAGALAYEQLDVLWNTTVFIEEEGVPSDGQVVGHTWKFVNKNGGPDRRFKNNRQLPKLLYQQMGLQGAGGLQKILHLSKVSERAGFDTAVNAMRHLVQHLKAVALLDHPS
jgi:hypothetical protein